MTLITPNPARTAELRRLALDLAEREDIPVAEAVKMLARALHDPITEPLNRTWPPTEETKP